MGIKNEKDGHLNNPLGTDPITSLIRKFAIPSIVSMLVVAAYNITDQIFIGNVVGMYGNAATNVAFPMVTLTAALAQLIGVGTAANFNINIGAKKQDVASQFVGTGLTLLSILGPLFVIILLLFKTPILLLCGATDNVLPLAELYFGITALGLPFLLFTNAISNLIRADGSPAYSMLATVSGAILNVLLDWLFMLVFKWGIQGAAAATVIGQIVSFCMCIWYLPRFKSFKIKASTYRLRLKYTIAIAKLGISNFINLTIMMLVSIVMNNTLTHYGALTVYGSDIPLAVSGVVAKLNSILSAFCVGIAQGCQPIHGFNMGAKKYARIKETYKKAIVFAITISILAFLLFQILPRRIINIFGVGDELYFEFAERYLRIFMMMVCIYGVQPLSINYFTGIGDSKRGIVLSLSRQGFFLIPLLIILPLFFGLDGVLYAGPIADVLACALSLSFVAGSFKRLTELQHNSGLEYQDK